jgi:protein Tex
MSSVVASVSGAVSASANPEFLTEVNLPNQAQLEVLISGAIAAELKVRPAQVQAAIGLLNEGATVPFISRYRKEVTDNLDDTQLRHLEERLIYLREMEDRRSAVVESIKEQGKLTKALFNQIMQADTKQRIEDLYLPYKQKRRTKAQIAKEAGLEPLADTLYAAALADEAMSPVELAAKYFNEQVPDVKTALDGARDIVIERFSEQADVLQTLRDMVWDGGWAYSKKIEDAKPTDAKVDIEKFRDYFDFAEPIKNIPSHRALALFRGRAVGVLSLRLGLDEERDNLVPHPCVLRLAGVVGAASVFKDADSKPVIGAAAFETPVLWLREALRWCWRVKLLSQIENELFTRLRETAETESIRVFATNLKDLLLAAPAGPKCVMGLDPGIRTGVKVAVVDSTGKMLDHAVIYPHEPRRDWQGSIATLGALCVKHNVQLISIGNGTASRETDKLAVELIEKLALAGKPGVKKIVVSEAGASVYSASEIAAKEFPTLDVSIRGAVSIARRLQDPLAELVKIDPKAIGVGQYQHDVNQRELARSLDAVVEDCVNGVGVDLNTASAPLLARVSGLTAMVAQRVVDYRDQHGSFTSRNALLQVPYLGEKAFQQAAGFLRINGGENPLDASSVHPEAYSVVERIMAKAKKAVTEIMGNRDVLRALSPTEFIDEKFGEPTIKDILQELEKPGRDPRGEFVTATFKDGVEEISDLREGMVLQGVVTNVANFGAFVDIGVHQDGLVHVSQLSDKFVTDPHTVVKAGQVVSVTVLEVDAARKRIALTMKKEGQVVRRENPRDGARDNSPRGGSGGGGGGYAGGSRPTQQRAPQPQTGNSSMADAFSKLRLKK